MDLEDRLQRHFNTKPDTDKAMFVAGNATVVGDVRLGRLSSVWYGAVLRGDINAIRIGEGSNLQDGVIVHLADDFGVMVGEYTTVGHRAILHACTVEGGCLIGMGATLMDGSWIGEGSIVGAHALVTQRFRCPPRSLVLGAPAKVVRTLSEEESHSIRDYATKYIEVARAHAAQGAG
ncbi:MAG: gamma carbonic anhydrase family protein [Opitutales bacterium]